MHSCERVDAIKFTQKKKKKYRDDSIVETLAGLSHVWPEAKKRKRAKYVRGNSWWPRGWKLTQRAPYAARKIQPTKRSLPLAGQSPTRLPPTAYRALEPWHFLIPSTSLTFCIRSIATRDALSRYIYKEKKREKREGRSVISCSQIDFQYAYTVVHRGELI